MVDRVVLPVRITHVIQGVCFPVVAGQKVLKLFMDHVSQRCPGAPCIVDLLNSSIILISVRAKFFSLGRIF